jgi:hypothetical protein
MGATRCFSYVDEVDERLVLDAYERCCQSLASGALRVASLHMMGADRRGGKLLFTLDARKPSAAADREAIAAWSDEISPVPVEVVMDPDPPNVLPA